MNDSDQTLPDDPEDLPPTLPDGADQTVDSAEDPESAREVPEGGDMTVPVSELDIDRAEMTISQFLKKKGLKGGVQLDDTDSSAAASLRDRQGRKYDLGKKIAEGGMGAVLDAKDHCIRRHVAMKVMHKALQSPSRVVRFIEEAQVTGQLEHPSIVPVHELGVDTSGNVFYTMKYVKGRTLKDVLVSIRKGDEEAIKEYPLVRLLNIFLRVCEAMSYAHAHDVIHRDLKPDNIMLGEYGEVLIVDWGLAKVLHHEDPVVEPEEDPSSSAAADYAAAGDDQPEWAIESDRVGDFAQGAQTMDGQVMGTPSFMPPEQAGGRLSEIDERSDIYSLGGVLYSILTLHNPIRGTDVTEMLSKVESGDITHPTQFGKRGSGKKGEDLAVELHHCSGKKVPESLAAVAMKALSTKPGARYQNVQNLQKDVQAYLDGFATLAENANLIRQCILLFNRNKKQATVLTAAVLLVAGLTAAFITQLKQEKGEAQVARDAAVVAANKAEAATLLAEANAEETRETLYVSEMHLALGALQGRDGIKEAKILLDHWYPKEGTTDLRGWEWYCLRARLDQSALFLPHPVASKAAAWSPDGQRAYTGDIGGKIRVWDAETGSLLTTFSGHTAQIYALDTSPSGGRLASLDRHGVLKIRDAGSGKVEREWKGAGGDTWQYTELDWSPDGTLLAVSDGPRALVILNTENGQIVTRFEEPNDISGAAWHADGQRLAIATINKPESQLLIWNSGTGETRRFDYPLLRGFYDAQWLPDEKIVGVLGKRVYLLDAAASNITHKVIKEGLLQVDVSASTGLISHAALEGRVHVTDPKTGETKAVFLGHILPVWRTVWSPDGSRILSVGIDGARIWQAGKDGPESLFKGSATSLGWRPGGGGLTVTSWDGAITLMPPDHARGIPYKQGIKGCQTAWSPDGEHIAVATDTHLSLWAWGGQHPLWQVPLEDNGWPSKGHLLWEPGGERLIYGGAANPTYSIYSARDGTMLRKWDAPQDDPALAWHPQGRLLSLHHGHGRVTVTDADSGREVEDWKTKFRVGKLAWHPSGDMLATGRSNDFRIELWKMPGAKKVGEIKVGSTILDMAWSPDGRLLAVGSSDGALRLWDLQRERIVLTVREADAWPYMLAWDDTGTRLAYMDGEKESQVNVLDAGRGYLAENAPQALPWLDQPIEAHPDRLSYRAKRARLLKALGRDDEARAEWGRVAKLRPDNPYFAAWSRGETWKPPVTTPAPAPRETTPEEQAAAARKRQERLNYFNQFGRNSDGNVTRAGYIKFFTDQFSSLDKDGSGTLNAAEFSHPAFQKMDTDGDGQATMEEYKQLYAGHHKRFDTNGDGFWAKDEIPSFENREKLEPTLSAKVVEESPAKAPRKAALEPARSERQKQWTKLLLSMDRDGDGKASWEEYLEIFTAHFAGQDVDKSGTLSATEFNNPGAFKFMDTDGDGQATLDEHKKLRSGHFKSVDKNGDGFWTLDEI